MTPAVPLDTATWEDQSRASTPISPVQKANTKTDYFHVEALVQRHSRKGRGTRATKFHEEFGYEAVVSGPDVTGELFSLPTMIPDTTATTAMNATSDPDTMYFHQDMQQKDAKDFVRAAHKEFQNRDIIEAHQVSSGMRIFSAVWAMKRKRRVKSQEV
jgi:hypothetical protein